ncbi:MAG: transposase [Lachnospiraceae bacterium]|nr:transposase [Lachnospiraceae bacterium]
MSTRNQRDDLINQIEFLKQLKLKREQRRPSRKYENKKKGGAAQSKNIQKQVEVVQKIHHTLANIRDHYSKTTVNEIVKTKPSYITIEDLNVSGMMNNKHLSKAVQQQKFYQFRQVLTQKCKENSIELRVVDRWFPSSKICNCCGRIKKDLK